MFQSVNGFLVNKNNDDKYPFKICTYRNYCMFGNLGQKPVQNSQLY